MMALKSGLLSESTWALDVLSVLLRDDVSVAWFGLQHLPGLVEVLLEHLRRCLIELFPGDFDDLEVLFEASSAWSANSQSTDVEDWKAECRHGGCPSKSAGVGSQVVHVEANSPDEELVADDKRWDVYGEVDSSLLDWQMGRGDLTTHILTRFHRAGSLEFASHQFFGHRRTPSTDQASSAVPELIGVGSQNSEHSASTDRIAQQVSSKSSAEPLDSVAETTGAGSNASEAVPPTSEASRPPATCRHRICRTTATAEDADDEDRNWLRLELKRLWLDECDGTGDDDLNDNADLSVLSVVGADFEDTSFRCLALSNIIRGLSFIPGNDSELARHPGVVAALSRLLLFRHQHSRSATRQLDDVLLGRPGHEVVEALRENALVTFANVAGQLELASYPEEICVPVLDGLLHWASCRAACAVDPLPSVAHHRDPVSAQRLALEALCKLCVTDANVDLLLATPPFDRLVSILGNLVGAMANPDCDQVWREFAIVFASSLVAGDPGVARALAVHRCTVPVLVGFVEAAVADAAGGTSVDMVRRATAVLRAVAELPEGRSDLARNYQFRLLQLAVAPSLDSAVLNSFAHILHVCSGV